MRKIIPPGWDVSAGAMAWRFNPFKTVRELAGSFKSRELGARLAFRSLSWWEASVTLHCGFDFRHSLWLPFVGYFAVLKGLWKQTGMILSHVNRFCPNVPPRRLFHSLQAGSEIVSRIKRKKIKKMNNFDGRTWWYPNLLNV